MNGPLPARLAVERAVVWKSPFVVGPAFGGLPAGGDGSMHTVGMRPRDHHPLLRRAGGFTLVELLTVTAVIGVLAGLTYPALSVALSRARETQCLNQLRQLGLGLQMYADADAMGRLPNSTDGRPPIAGRPVAFWLMGLTNFVPSAEALRVCPSDAAKRLRRRSGDLSSSYLLNTCLDYVLGPDGQPLAGAQSCPQLDQLNAPGETFLTFEASVAGYRAGEDRVHPETWLLGWEHVRADIDPSRHRARANYLFGDGQVRSVAAEVLRRRIQAGDNFAVSPP